MRYFLGSCCLLAAVALIPSAIAQETISTGSRIIGGKKTSIADHPWQIAMMVKRGDKLELCSGSIISAHWILTAAHCVNGVSKTNVLVKTGVTDYTKEGNWQGIEDVRVHPQFTVGKYINDIALLRVATQLSGALIPLAAKELELKEGLTMLIVAGWGETDSGSLSDDLREADVPYVENGTCNRRAAYNGSVTPDMLCAGFRGGGVDSCQGDSGGPLTIGAKSEAILVGVVSHGDGCARRLKYGVYARVSHYRTWINDVVVQNP
jgi:trypsin